MGFSARSTAAFSSNGNSGRPAGCLNSPSRCSPREVPLFRRQGMGEIPRQLGFPPADRDASVSARGSRRSGREASPSNPASRSRAMPWSSPRMRHRRPDLLPGMGEAGARVAIRHRVCILPPLARRWARRSSRSTARARGMVNNVCVPSDVAPDYAPPGQALISVIGVSDCRSPQIWNPGCWRNWKAWFGSEGARVAASPDRSDRARTARTAARHRSDRPGFPQARWHFRLRRSSMERIH